MVISFLVSPVEVNWAKPPVALLETDLSDFSDRGFSGAPYLDGWVGFVIVGIAMSVLLALGFSIWAGTRPSMQAIIVTLYFAYGSNMHRTLMRRHCPGAEEFGTAALFGCRFMITTDGYARSCRDPVAGVRCIVAAIGARSRGPQPYESPRADSIPN
jgi:hypothetical protein